MLELLDTLSLPGDAAKPNEDAFGAGPRGAAVLDGATMVSDPLLHGPSDAAWIAHFAARRLMAHLSDNEDPREVLRLALADAEKSFTGLRRRPPKETYEVPYASMMFAAARTEGLEFLWYGDCAALVARPGEPAEVVGDAFEKRAAEARRVRMLTEARGVAPVMGSGRPEFLPALRAARNKVNTRAGGWLFSPDVRAAEHVTRKTVAAPEGTLVLLASDGFLALASDYAAYSVQGLVEAAAKGLEPLGRELRAVEEADADGRRFARLKKHDDATAVLFKISPSPTAR